MTIFIQSLILSYLIGLTLKNILKELRLWQFYFTILFLEFFTVVGFVSGQLITDVFMSVCVLCIANLVFFSNNKKDNVLLYIIFFVATATHMSHVGSNIMLLLLISILFLLIKSIKPIIRIKKVFVLMGVSLLSVVTMGSTLSKSKHVFVVARMAGSGMLQDYLKESCKNKAYKLCNSVNEIPYNTNDFLWEDNSPFNIEYSSWKDSKNDFEDIISETFSTWKYIKLHLRDFFNNGVKQLRSFKAGDGNGPFKEDNILYKRLEKYTYSDASFYKNSKQIKGGTLSDDFIEINKLYKIVIYLSLIFISIMFLIKKNRVNLGVKFWLIVCFILSTILINAFLNAGLVIVADRFGAKVIWLVPFVFIVSIFLLFTESKLKHKKAT
jgi:hypothetical protein